MSKKYIYACIRVPMEVCPDGSYEPCNEYAEVTFEKCDKLPDEPTTNDYNLDALLSAFNINSDHAEPISLTLTKEEIKRNTRSHRNLTNTFKNRRGKANRYSAKNRKSIVLIDVPNSNTLDDSHD